ncbi:22439_t:CDS:2 [Cetraspora pellucida]|uniref:22439_t:CDS:1 n=1 Tax=Cetraspora pellucida TaxID=1433469 RepID=A0A9N9HFA8_9GLOM|nr:22439_t:CDS:2 [Cetraspora pellucida]
MFKDQIIYNNNNSVLAPFEWIAECADEKDLYKALLNSREIYNNKKLERFIIHEDKRLKDYTDS